MKIRLRLYIYLIVLIGIALYLNSLTNSFIADDFDQIVGNTASLNPTNALNFFTGSTFYSGGGTELSGLHYRPVMLFFYSIIFTLVGLKPIFFHLFQLTLHISNSIMIFLFLRYFFKNPTSFVLSLLFLVHPINNETVVYIANLQDTLFMFFGLLALLLIQFEKIKNNLKSLLVLSILLTLSLFSKETGILFAFIMVIQSYLFKKIPLKLTLTVSLISTLFYLLIRFVIAKIYIPTQAVAPIANSTIVERLINLPEILFYYLKSLIYPVNLTSFQFWFIKTPTFQNFTLPTLVIVLLAILLFLFARLLKKTKGNEFKYFLFFLSILILGLSVHTQIIPLEMTVATRWFYLPFIGAIGLLGLLIEKIVKTKKQTLIFLIFSVIILSLLSLNSYTRNTDWETPIKLFTTDTKIDKENFFLENNLGAEYLMKEEYQLARPHIEKSVRLYPYFGNLNNMAVISSSTRDNLKTKEYLLRAIKLDNNYIVTENYTKFFYGTASPDETINFITSSLKTYPNNATLLMYLGLAYEKNKEHQKALMYTKKAYELNPNELTKKTYEGIKNGNVIKKSIKL